MVDRLGILNSTAEEERMVKERKEKPEKSKILINEDYGYSRKRSVWEGEIYFELKYYGYVGERNKYSKKKSYFKDGSSPWEQMRSLTARIDLILLYMIGSTPNTFLFG